MSPNVTIPGGRPLTDEERDRAEAVAPLAYRLAWDAIRRSGRTGDAAQRIRDIAADRLMSAVRTHDRDRGRLTTHVHCSVRMGIRSRGYGRTFGHSPDACQHADGFVEVTTPDHRDPIAEVERMEESRAMGRRIRAAMAACLTDRERLVVERLYGLDGEPAGDGPLALSASLGLCEARIHQLKRSALAKLRAELAGLADAG